MRREASREDRTYQSTNNLDAGSEDVTEIEDLELKHINECLQGIENIMVAEKKRRIESNEIMSKFIEEHLQLLDEGITNKIDDDFQHLEERFAKIEKNLANIENQIELQVGDLEYTLEQTNSTLDTQISQTNSLLVNYNEQKKRNQGQLKERKEKLFREVQLLLKKDDVEWSQIKNQVFYKLHALKNLDETDDFTADIEQLNLQLDQEAKEREEDDQEIINLVNDIYSKMYKKFM